MRGRPGLWVIAGCVALAVAARVVSHDLTSRALLDLAALLATTASWIGVRRRHGPARAAWAYLAGGLTCWLFGDITWDTYTVLRGEIPTVSFADLLYLLGYPLMAVGVVRMLRLRAPGGLREGVLDGLVGAIAATLAVWQFLVEPSLAEPASLLEHLLFASYPLVDVLLFVAVAWLVLSPGRRRAPTFLLMGFLGATLVLDVVYAFILDRGGLDLEWLDAGYPISYALLAAAALHADAEELTTPEQSAPRRLHPGRVLFFGLALLTAPVLTISRPSGASVGRASFYLTASVLLGVIVLARFTMAVREREAAQGALAYQATHDLLTGLVNRTLLLDRLDHAIDRDLRRQTLLAVLYLDLDRFKAVNDTWGHRSGDTLLMKVAARLRAAVRPGDTIARLGGDEFVVLCEDLAGDEDTITVADRIVGGLREPFDVERGVVRVSASVGIALRTHPDETGESLLRDADAAMYRAKDAGRDRWEMFDAAMRARVDERRETESALQRAVHGAQMRLLYQPIVRLDTAEVVGFEALVRWERPGRGLVEPDDFIGLAEDTGLVVPIGEWVLEQACRQLRRWNDTYWDRAPLDISVNVSARQFNQPGFAGHVAEILDRTGIDPRCLILEITETVLAEEAEHALSQLEAAKNLGVRLAVDDFGTGYSALAYLRRFPLDIIKIDRTFIEELGTIAPDTTLVAAVVALGHALGHEVIAEGAERAEQVAVLRALGCKYVQGFYFSVPLTLGEAEAVLRSSRRLPLAVRDRTFATDAIGSLE